MYFLLMSCFIVLIIVLTLVAKVDDLVKTIVSKENDSRPKSSEALITDRVLLFFLLAFLVWVTWFAVSGRASVFPEGVSTLSSEIDNLFWLIFTFVMIAFVISLIALLYPLIKFSSQKNPTAKHIAGSGWGQMRWIVIPVVLLALSDFVILFVEYGTWAKTEKNIPQADVQIGVTGRQWNWIFLYPGPDNKLYTADDLTIDEQNSDLHIPVNKTIVFDLRARDVLHNFSIPNVRFKQDAIPGRTLIRWFKVTKTGKYEIQCAELCGILHSKMRNFLVVDSEEDYKKFTAELYKTKNEEQKQLVSLEK